MIVGTIPKWLAVQWWIFPPRIRWLDRDRWGFRGCMWAGGLGEKGQTYDFLKEKTTSQLKDWCIGGFPSFVLLRGLFFGNWKLTRHIWCLALGTQTTFFIRKRRFAGLFVVKASWVQRPARAELFVHTCQKRAGIAYSTCCFWRFDEHLMRTQWSTPQRFWSSQGHHSIDKGWSRMCTLALMWGRFMSFLGIVEIHVS